MKRIPELLVVFGIIFSPTLSAQITIGSNSTVKVKGEVSTTGSVNNSSAQTDLSTAHVVLSGANQTLSSTSPQSIQSLTLNGGGTKTMQGDWTITQDLTFTSGIVSIGSGKLVYAGTAALTGNTASFVNGILFQHGTGTRFYPIGAGSTYAPMAFGSVQEGNIELGVRVFTTGASLSLPVDINSIASNRYWEVTSSGGTFSGSGVSLYAPGSSIDAAQKLVVVQADALGADATNLGGGLTDDFVSSFQPATKPILTIGIAEAVGLQIKDLITPFTVDDINDKLKIVNVEYTVENTVTLLDRWGVPVKIWKNFRNYDDPTNPNTDNFDFSSLSPGNYICVLEYKLAADSPKENLTQMITVLKGN